MYPRNYSNRPSALQRLLSAYEAQFRHGREQYFEEQAYLQIIEFFEEDCQLSKSLEASERSLRHHPSSAGLYLKKAQLLMDMKREEEAIPLINQAQVLAPGQVEAKLLYAEALIGIGEEEEATNLLEYLKYDAPPEQMSDILLIEALIYDRNEQYELMFYTLRSAVLSDPSNEEALSRLAIATSHTKKYKASIELYESLLERDAYLPVAWYNLAQARTYEGEYELAIEAYEYAFAIEEAFLPAIRDCAELCMELSMYHRALKHYLELLELQGADADGELYYQIGQCYVHMNRPQAAATYFLYASRLEPLNEDIFFQLGNCYAMEDQWSNAVHYFEKALEIDPNQDEFHAALAEAHFHLQNHEEAIECMEEALLLNDMEVRYWVLMATFLIDSGEEEEALALLEEGGATVPGTELLYCRVACLFATGRRQEACQRLAEALSEDFDMHYSLFELLPELEQDPDVQSLIAIYTI